MNVARVPMAAVFAFAAIGGGAGAADWPQWRGPNRDGASAETLAVSDWPPILAWSTNIAAGESRWR